MRGTGSNARTRRRAFPLPGARATGSKAPCSRRELPLVHPEGNSGGGRPASGAGVGPSGACYMGDKPISRQAVEENPGPSFRSRRAGFRGVWTRARCPRPPRRVFHVKHPAMSACRSRTAPFSPVSHIVDCAIPPDLSNSTLTPIRRAVGPASGIPPSLHARSARLRTRPSTLSPTTPGLFVFPQFLLRPSFSARVDRVNVLYYNMLQYINIRRPGLLTNRNA
jgi:hypothetical protein